MNRFEVKLLDCTLRDGGYINNWKWGFDSARDIIYSLIKAGIEVIEVGFLRDIESYNRDVTVSNSIEDLNRLIPSNIENVMFSAMAMQSNYDIEQLCTYSGHGIEMIRVTAHDYDLDAGIEFARKAKEKGYKVSFNPINIKGYSDEELLSIFRKVNEIKPFQFSIVDTFGSMKKKDFDRIARMADNNLDVDICLGLHLHENMSISSCISQGFVDMHMNRTIVIDGSLMGMGRTPGNLPIELIADYLNDVENKSYDIEYLLDAIQDYIKEYKGETKWGYSIEYFISARFNIHRNYAEYLLNKGDLTCKDINHILAKVGKDKATTFDSEYIEDLYKQYKNHAVDDNEAFVELHRLLAGKDVLIIAPGASITTYKDKITTFINEKHPIVISLNFISEDFDVDMAFFSNKKRMHYLDRISCKTIVTSNLSPLIGDYVINYNRLTSDFSFGVNSFIYLLRLLKSMDILNLTVAGADGYSQERENYFNSKYKSDIKWDSNYNKNVMESIRIIGLIPTFLTPSAYEKL